jgi:hypothetical protein
MEESKTKPRLLTLVPYIGATECVPGPSSTYRGDIDDYDRNISIKVLLK